MLKKLISLPFICLILFHSSAFSLEPSKPLDPNNPTDNYCKDRQKNDKWAKTLKNNPDDPVIIKLFALRSGLCVMIDTGAVSLKDAIDYFEEEKTRLIEQSSTDKKRVKPEIIN